MNRSARPQEWLGRASRASERNRRQARPIVESLEGRALLSTVQASTGGSAQTFATHRAVPESLYAPVVQRSFPTYQISFQVNPDSDPAGTNNIFQKNVLVDGYAVPFSSVWLAIGPRGYYNNYTTADYSGHYSYLLPVNYGTTELSVFAENPAQDYSQVSRLNVTRGNPIVAWDSIALRAIGNANLSPAEASRALAILHAAQYDAVAAVDFPGAAYQVHVTAPKGASAEAAANAAASTVLEALFPSQLPAFQTAENAAEFGLPKSVATTDGLALGRQVAQLTLTNRAADGSNLSSNYVPSPLPGLWKPTPPSFVPAQDAQWGLVTPFVAADVSVARPPAPPSVGSAAYDQALQQVELLGRSNSTSRTTDQTAAAQFWDSGPGSFTNPGHWNAIAEQFSVARKDTLAQDAKLFAQLDFAMADAEIATLGAAYTDNLWRPVSAIQQTDPTWTPLLSTPPTPSYPADHAATSTAAANVLSAAFGTKTRFTDSIFAATGVARTYSSFSAAAAEAGMSRVYGGVQFAFDVNQGAALGDQVGKSVLAHFPTGK